MDDVALVICSNLSCKVAEDGKCLEGLPLADCIHYGRQPLAPAKIEEAKAEDGSTGLPLQPAELLDVHAASRVGRRAPTNVVAIIGTSEAGKTSLIAGLFDLLQVGEVAGFAFSRCATFFGMEKACHDARITSQNVEPKSPRTNLGFVSFYHLELSPPAERRPLQLLLGDRSGEDYRAITDDVSIAKTYPEVQRADSFTLLIDGERLLDTGGRHNLVSDMEMMVQALQDSDSLSCSCRLAIVLTKIDAVRASANRDRAEKDFLRFVDTVRSRYGTQFLEIQKFEVAASPKANTAERGEGLPELLSFWALPDASTKSFESVDLPTTRAMDRLSVVK